MPTLNVKKHTLMKRLGKTYSDEEFDHLCFEFGIELDEVTSEKEIALKEKGVCNNESGDIIYKIDLPANRYDLLSIEGLVLALKIFAGSQTAPKYNINRTKKLQPLCGDTKLEVPWKLAVCAVVRDIKLDQETVDSILDLQEKLHSNIGRKKAIFEICFKDEHTKQPFSISTSNLLIVVKSVDKEKAIIAMDTVLVMLLSSSAASEKHAVEFCITEKDAQLKSKLIPTPLEYRKENVSVKYINKTLGTKIGSKEIESLLVKMAYTAKAVNSETIDIEIPPSRHDVINQCDVAEDVAIAYGYNNLIKTLPKNATIATQVFLNKLSDQLRHESARCGFSEALNFALCSEDELKTMLRELTLDNAVHIGNPKTAEFQVARTRLLPGLLRTINSNKQMPLPLKLFEIGDVVVADSNFDVGACNRRHLAAIYYGKHSARFEVVHGFLDRIMQVLNITTKDYKIQSCQNNLYLDGRSAKIVYKDSEEVGSLGILHPEVLSNFDLNMPSSAIELDIERLAALSPLC